MGTTTMAALVGMMGFAGPVLAQVGYTQQERSVRVGRFGTAAQDPGSDITVSAPGFGPFSHIEHLDSNGSDMWASQSSTLGPSGFTLAGSCFATNLNAIDARAISRFDVLFTIADATPCELTGSFFSSPYYPSFARLSRDGSTVYEQAAQFGGSMAYNAVLAPGTYRFEAEMGTRNAGLFNRIETTYQIGFAVVPSPSAAALALIAGIGWNVRRRPHSGQG